MHHHNNLSRKVRTKACKAKQNKMRSLLHYLKFIFEKHDLLWTHQISGTLNFKYFSSFWSFSVSSLSLLAYSMPQNSKDHGLKLRCRCVFCMLFPKSTIQLTKWAKSKGRVEPIKRRLFSNSTMHAGLTESMLIEKLPQTSHDLWASWKTNSNCSISM